MEQFIRSRQWQISAVAPTDTCLGRVIDITNDKGFTGANLVFSGVLRKLRKDGLDLTQHKKATPFDNMQKLYQSGVLGPQDPVALQNKVVVELSLHFTRRGREGLRELRKDSFRIEVDASGKEYVSMAYHEEEKNHQGGDISGVKVNEKEAAMYAVDKYSLVILIALAQIKKGWHNFMTRIYPVVIALI